MGRGFRKMEEKVQDTSLVTQKLLERNRELPVINHSPLPEYDYDHLD